jgi:hypothetical protein
MNFLNVTRRLFILAMQFTMFKNVHPEMFMKSFVQTLKKRYKKDQKQVQKLTKSIQLIDKNNVHLSECVIDSNGNISKRYIEEASFWWESKVYVSLVDHDIFALMTAGDMKMTYFVGGMTPLRVYLKEHSDRYMIILYELFQFMNGLMKLQFVHGNMHIDNIYVSLEKGLYNFKLIDLSNAYIPEQQPGRPFYRSSFLGEFDAKESHVCFGYWDFFTLVTSLKCEYANDVTKTIVINKILSLFIDTSILDGLQEVLSPKNKTMYFEKQIFWEDF